MTVALPQPPVAKLTAFQAIGRGLANLRANWQLVLMYLAQTLAVTAVVLLGVAVPVILVGFDRLEGLDGWEPASGGEAWADFVALLAELGAPFFLGLLGAAVVWFLALVLLSWFQGGFYGVLAAADRQAPPGRVANAGFFRTFSLANYSGWGMRFLWRYFWFWNLVGVVVLLWILLALGIVFGAIWGAEAWGPPAAVGIGCGGALPLVFLSFALNFWAGLAAAHAGQEGSSVVDAARSGLRVLGERFGAVLLVFIVYLGAAMALSIVLFPLGILSALVMEESFALYVSLQAVNFVLQLVLTSVLAAALAAVFVALVRSEAPR